jgi:organic hydroperoxide reductase OsmC/OhrA
MIDAERVGGRTMSEHHATITWRKGSTEFTYETYPRAHTWSFPSGIQVEASSAPDYLGSADRVNPEEALVAALSSCHMLTFLALAARKRLVVERYEDSAVGVLEKNSDGKLAITRVTLRPRAVFAQNAAPSPQDLQRLHEKAHEHCFIANSVRTAVSIESE